MPTSPTLSLAAHFAHAYSEAYAYHGDLDLSAHTFTNRLRQILTHHLQPADEEGAASALLASLHKNDLYLSCACTSSADVAWKRFLDLYGRFIGDLARHACGGNTAGEEVADFVLTDLSLPDQLGRPRIGSYEGRGSLAAWLRAIVIHQSYKECQRSHHRFERLDDLAELPDPVASIRLEASLRDRACRETVSAALHEAINQLSDRDRLLLLLRYEEGLRGEEVARLLRVSPSTVSRGLHTAQQRMKKTIVYILTGLCEGEASAINECLTDIVENPAYSLLRLLKDVTSSRSALAE
jgi:RNA polymerase sigma-70 factor